MTHTTTRDVYFVRNDRAGTYQLTFRPNVGTAILAVYSYTRTETEDGQAEHAIRREFAANCETIPADLEAEFRRLASLDGGDQSVDVRSAVELKREDDFETYEEFLAYEAPLLRVAFRLPGDA